ncbi:MAG TPA: hypothetical protein VNH53_05195 [Sphingomicrobium sp.]|nr:hypothetical protein [Sphingomicrobium sp.]
MARYKISARNAAGGFGLDEPLTAEDAYQKVLELRDAGYDNITLTDTETGERITDVERLLLRKRNG